MTLVKHPQTNRLIDPELHPVDPERREAIMELLRKVEEEYDVTVLFAVESGSRAWGFASPDSDYDVRFVYVHKPDWYMTVNPGRDVIEYRVDDLLDASGWDLRKTLHLLAGSNPTLLEWMGSSIVYRRDDVFATELRELGLSYMQRHKVYHHYMGMAHETWKRFFSNPEKALYKKYFYVLRPLMAASWVYETGEMPPTEFEMLRTNIAQLIEGTTAENLDHLLFLKRNMGETKEGPRDQFQPLEAFLTSHHEYMWARRDDDCLKATQRFRKQTPMEPLDDFFRKWVTRCK